jgi:hypothetical protein
MTVIFLFSGQARTSPFNIIEYERNIDILNSYNKYIFTEKFKSTYDYKIYISSDNIHLHDTISFFSQNNIGNIHLIDTNYYYKSITHPIKNIQYYLDSYNDNNDWNSQPPFNKHVNSIHQHYKLLDCYNLFKEDIIKYDKIDYIVRMRMDTVMKLDIFDILLSFSTNPDIEIIIHWDFFAMGKPNIMECYCNGLDNKYGKYTYTTKIPDKLPVMYNYNTVDKIRWKYATERQLFEMLFEYCNNKNIDINKTIYNKQICLIVRHNLADVFVSGSCRLLTVINSGYRKISPIHSMFYNFAGVNFLGKLYNTKQHIQFIKFIKDEIDIPNDILKKFLTSYSNIQNCEDITLIPVKNQNIKSKFIGCEWYIFEICSLKLYKNNGFDVHHELTSEYNFVLQTGDELLSDLHTIRELIPLHKKILFQVHFRPNIIFNSEDKKIHKREIIYNVVNQYCKNTKNTYMYDPSILLKTNHSFMHNDSHFTHIGHRASFDYIYYNYIAKY